MTDLKTGAFSWVDLTAHDMNAAKKWYGDLFGWTAVDQDTQGGPPYAMFQSGGRNVGGLGQCSDEMKAQGVPPMWNSYVLVDNAQETEGKVREFGGKVTVPTMKVMDAGSLAFFQDPGGASFAVWQPDKHKGAGLYNRPVSLGWNELLTRDVSKVKDFYGKVFGWEFSEMDMGPMKYTMVKNQGRDNGGFLPMDEKMQGIPSHWMIYFVVENCDATVEKATSTGGSVRVPAVDAPPGRFAGLADAQGAGFSVIQLANPPA